MFSLYHDRFVLYEAVSKAFQAIKCNPRILELGVHNGTNAVLLMKTLNASNGVFVDAWDSLSILKNYSPFESLPNWVAPLEAFAHYFGGDLRQQSTFDSLYKDAVSKLSSIANTQIIKLSTSMAYSKMKDLQYEFDFIYIDANHQYEFVLRDLMEYSSLLAAGGFIQLNDCVLSRDGAKQNLGVLRALHEFIARNNHFTVLAQTRGEWADVLIARRNENSAKIFENLIRSSNLPYVEIPEHLVFNSKCINGKMSYII